MEGSKDLLVLDTKDLGTLSWREIRNLLVFRFGKPSMEESKDLLVFVNSFMEGSKDLLVLGYQRFGNPFMEGSKDFLVLDYNDFGTLSWRDVRIF